MTIKEMSEKYARNQRPCLIKWGRMNGIGAKE